MLLDFLAECTSIIKCSYKDSINAGVLTDNYTIKKSGDMLSWKLSNPSVSAVTFTILSSEVKILKDIQIELSGFANNDSTIRIETSIDYINWYEPRYKNDDKYLYVRTPSPSGNYYFNLTEPNLGKDTILTDNTLVYSFKKFDENTKETVDIYNNFEFKFIRIFLDNLSLNPNSEGYFKTFSISIEDTFSISNNRMNILQIKSDMYTQPKVFEQEELIPDLIRNFHTMLDEKNLKTSELLYSLPAISENPFAVGTPAEGIGNDIIEIDTVIY